MLRWLAFVYSALFPFPLMLRKMATILGSPMMASKSSSALPANRSFQVSSSSAIGMTPRLDPSGGVCQPEKLL